MGKNLKTFFYLSVIVFLGFAPSLFKKLGNAKEEFHEQAETSREIYTGKIGQVFNPLDKAYVVTDKLKSLIEEEKKLDFSRYQKWPVISIWVDPIDLHSKQRGILENFEKKGRLWERASFVTYYEKGAKRFASYAGLRLHGGDSRKKKYKEKSLRLHFRKSYEEPFFLKGLKITLGDDTPVKRLVLHKDNNHHFVADLSFSIIKQIGGWAPNIKPVVVYLNGKMMGYQYMVEQLSDEQLTKYYGHEDFIYYNLKGDNSDFAHQRYQSLITWIKHAPTPLDINEFKEIFDIENFTANILSIIYTGSSDWAQGILTKDMRDPKSKWKFIAWDFDRAFWPWDPIVKAREQNSQIDGFHVIIDSYKRALRSRILRRLFNESSEYVDYFFSKVDDLFEKQLTKEFFDRKFGEYERLIKDSDKDSVEFQDVELLKEFVKNRKKILCELMLQRFEKMASTCRNNLLTN